MVAGFSAASPDTALAALFVPFESGHLRLPPDGRVLFRFPRLFVVAVRK